MADAQPTPRTSSLAQITRITQRDGSNLGDIIYQLIREGHLIVDDGILKRVPRG